MSILKSLFGGQKEPPKPTITIQAMVPKNDDTPSVKKVDPFVQDLVLLSIAEKYKVGEKKYPDYFRSRFGIGFPNERFQALEKKGYIRPATAIESLPHLKATELKAIASKFELKATGKKDELCSRITENVSEMDLSYLVPERYWMLTGTGKDLLEENEYISFFMQQHPYSLENIGLDICTYSELFAGQSNCSVRDTLWEEFNRRSIAYYAIGKQKGEFRRYCDLLRTMSLFLEEEKRHTNALAVYMRYIHYRVNFEASLQAINYYKLLKNIDNALDTLYMRAEIYPFIAEEIHTISDACDFDSKKLKLFMEDSFSKEKDTGIFSPSQLTEFVMCGLNGDVEGQKSICNTAFRAAIRKIR